jgi:biopolymer transport protein ExbB/TolQ
MNDLQQTIYDISSALLWPVLIAVIACLVWVLIEFGAMLYEVWLRFRYRDLDALQSRALRARTAFADGKPRTAYRYLQENTYSIVVVRFLYDLIRNYQGERLEAKPLKLLQEYEFYSVRRLNRTRILTRLGPMLGLMGTLIPLSPALVGLAEGDIEALSENLVTAFSVTVLGLLIGGLAFVASILRDRMYSQDISDMEYLLELLQGDDSRMRAGRRRFRDGRWDAQPGVEYAEVPEDEAAVTSQLPAVAVAGGVGAVAGADMAAPGGAPADAGGPAPELDALTSAAPGDAGGAAELPGEHPELAADAAQAGPGETEPAAPEATLAGSPLSFDDPDMSWRTDDDPFADLGPVDVPEKDDTPGSTEPR